MGLAPVYYSWLLLIVGRLSGLAPQSAGGLPPEIFEKGRGLEDRRVLISCFCCSCTLVYCLFWTEYTEIVDDFTVALAAV